MNNEVEDFLRRVAQMRQQAEAQTKGQQQARAARPPKPQQQPVQPQHPPRPQPLQQQRPPRSLSSAVEAEIVDAELADRSDRVSRLVDQDMRGAQQLGEQSGRLGAEVDLADDKLEAHLHQVFDHKLGSLKSTSGDAASAAPDRTIADDPLNQIRRLLRSPASVRDAIVMAEIFRRPNF
jgi:hypothetical protein